MELNYTIQEQDFIDYNMYFIQHDALTQKTIRRMQLLLAGLVLVGGLALMYCFDSLNTLSVIVYAVFAVGAYFYAPWAFRQRAKKNVRLTIKRAMNKHICGAKTMKADAEGVSLSGEGEESRYTYDAFKRVTTAPNQVYLYLDDLSALIVPNSAFSDQAHKEQFIRMVETHIADAKILAQKEAPADEEDETEE